MVSNGSSETITRITAPIWVHSFYHKERVSGDHDQNDAVATTLLMKKMRMALMPSLWSPLLWDSIHSIRLDDGEDDIGERRPSYEMAWLKGCPKDRPGFMMISSRISMLSSSSLPLSLSPPSSLLSPSSMAWPRLSGRQARISRISAHSSLFCFLFCFLFTDEWR